MVIFAQKGSLAQIKRRFIISRYARSQLFLVAQKTPMVGRDPSNCLNTMSETVFHRPVPLKNDVENNSSAFVVTITNFQNLKRLHLLFVFEYDLHSEKSNDIGMRSTTRKISEPDKDLKNKEENIS
ncbi:hypothetical protein TNIN_171991 [Trichonephila inaurata madagascariensis]|uniref:Uncharacterized protein n=1 Tax=Trichonephila inaurata madagascariensis TaxID=2747483 RepID=A0A8X7BXI4_9ARAC|nr:hypothetical protein TNIN_171991 [Trichonephila inaurata madagascariensis]